MVSTSSMRASQSLSTPSQTSVAPNLRITVVAIHCVSYHRSESFAQDNVKKRIMRTQKEEVLFVSQSCWIDLFNGRILIQPLRNPVLFYGGLRCVSDHVWAFRISQRSWEHRRVIGFAVDLADRPVAVSMVEINLSRRMGDPLPRLST